MLRSSVCVKWKDYNVETRTVVYSSVAGHALNRKACCAPDTVLGACLHYLTELPQRPCKVLLSPSCSSESRPEIRNPAKVKKQLNSSTPGSMFIVFAASRRGVFAEVARPLLS